MAELDPREIIEVQDEPDLDRAGHPIPNSTHRDVLYADGRIEEYLYDSTNPPPGDVPWGRPAGKRIDKAQAQLWKEEIAAQKKAEEDARRRPTNELQAGLPQPNRLDKPIDLARKRAQWVAAGVEPDTINAVFQTDANGVLLTGASGPGGRAGRTAAQEDASRAAAEHSRALTANIGQKPTLTPEEAAHVEAQTRLANTQAEDLKRKSLPQQQAILEEAKKTLDYIHSQLKTGVFTPEQANDYYKSVNDYVQTGLQGKTPYELWKEQKQQETERAKMATDLINERVRAGSSLAANMGHDYTTGMTANGGAIVNPGGYNPYASGFQQVNDNAAGGPELADIAKSLIAPLLSGVGSPQHLPGPSWVTPEGELNQPGEKVGVGPEAPGYTPEQEAWIAEHTGEEVAA